MTESHLALLRDARRVRRRGTQAIAETQRARLIEMIAHARTQSPVYRDLYANLGVRIEDVSALPVTSKRMLMDHFDEWSTDREITLATAEAFVDDASRVGAKYLDKYTLLTTSGTTGTRGAFVLDDRSMAVTNVIALRMLGSWLSARDVVRIVGKRARMAMVMAKSGHFASAVAAARLQERRADRVLVLSVHTPLHELVGALNDFDPALVAPYASAAALLATEQEAGRLRIKPSLITVTAEGLPTEEYERISRAFGARVGNSYAATECPFFSFSCEHWWLHVNTDWVIFEPVDADHRPVAPGNLSHTVLITNLANRVQPILRYDLGDSVVVRDDPCPCGSPFPAIRVQGRSAEVVTFKREGRAAVSIAPLAFATTLETVRGLAQSQVVHSEPTAVLLRLRVRDGADVDDVSRAARAAVERLLGQNGVEHVDVRTTSEPPMQAPGGKYRTVIPLHGGGSS